MNILIVDDDAIIRKWLSLLVTQACPSVGHIYESSDGVEAIEVCERNLIHFVITDIQMPRMGGLELVRELRSRFPNVRIAIISAYDEFKYVREALKLGAIDYILKAEMTLEDVVNLFSKVFYDQKLEDNMNNMNIKARSMDLQKKFTDYIGNRKLEIANILPELNPRMQPTNLCMFALFEKDLVPLSQQVISICEYALKGENLNGISFFVTGNICLVLYNCNSSIAEYQKAEYRKLTSIIDTQGIKYLESVICFTSHYVCLSDTCIRNNYLEIIDFLQSLTYYSQKVTDESLPFTTEVPKSLDMKTIARDIKSHLSTNNIDTALLLMTSSLETAHRVYLAPRYIRSMVAKMILAFLSDEFLNDYESESGIQPENIPSHLESIETASKMNDWMCGFIQWYQDKLHRGASKYSPSIEAVIRYIQNHAEDKISLDSLSKMVFLNKTYLSYLFKKDTGKNLQDYVEMIRIDHAKKLLEEGRLPLAEISEKAGFANQNYFTKVFREVTGFTPAKYSRLCLLNELPKK